MKDKKQVSLGEDAIGALLVKMSVPSILGILSFNLYNIVDTIYIARGIGAYAAGGLAVSFPLFLLLSAVSNTLGAGAASVISRALGKKDQERANRIAANTFECFWAVALLVTVFGSVFMEPMLYGMGVTEKLLPYAKDYTRIILLGAITSTGFSSLMRAEGNARQAMYQWIVPVAANIILDPIMIFIFHMGVKGAAIATVISQCISVIMSMHYFFLSGKSQLHIRLRHFIPDISSIVEVISIGIPSFLQLASYSVVIILINNVLRSLGGDYTISAYGIVNKATSFLLIPIQGIVQGIQPIIGYNYGAQKPTRVKDTLKKSSIIAGAYGILVTILLCLTSRQIMAIFSKEEEILTIGSTILIITNLGITFSGIHIIQTAYFQAMGKTKISLVLSLCNNILCLIPSIMILSTLLGTDGVWFSFPVSAVIAFAISTAFVLNHKSVYSK